MVSGKTCTKCGQEKPLTDFTKDLRRPDGRGSWCVPCNRSYSNALRVRPDQIAKRVAHYQNNKKSLLETNRQRRTLNKDRYRETADRWYVSNRESMLAYYQDRGRSHLEYLSTLKQDPCTDCGLKFPPFCMEFDHVRGVKRFAIGKMANHTRTAVDAELAKCELVCCACHRVRTQARKGESRLPRVQVFREWLNGLKNSPCVDCGKVLANVAMDFDHVRGVKVTGVAQMWSWNRAKVIAEIAKCDLVCANCHRIRTCTRKDEGLAA